MATVDTFGLGYCKCLRAQTKYESYEFAINQIIKSDRCNQLHLDISIHRMEFPLMSISGDGVYV